MSAYLELRLKKHQYRLISSEELKNNLSWYKSDKVKQMDKDREDDLAQKELNLFNEDKSAFLLSKLILETKKVKNYTSTIKGWVQFFGLLWIIGFIVLILTRF